MIVELDGARVAVGTGGALWRADRPTLLLAHGAGLDRTFWVLLARYFARHGHNVVAPDLPAHGASGGAPLASVEAQAEWLWRLVDALRADGTLPPGALDCCGHSMGALDVLAMAALRPDAVRRLVLLGAGYPMRVGDALLAAASDDLPAAAAMITAYGHAHASRLGRNPLAGVSLVNLGRVLLERSAPGVLHADLAACNAWRGAESVAEGLAPGRVAVVAGDADRMTPMRATGALADLLGAEVTVIEDCGHMLPGEQPEATLAALRRLLGNGAADA